MIRLSTLLFILLASALSLALFSVKYQVQNLTHELRTLNHDIAENERAIHVLNAEWSYLNNPARLRRLAVRYLGMQPLDPHQLVSWSEFDARVPEKKDTISMAAKETPASSPSSLADRRTAQ